MECKNKNKNKKTQDPKKVAYLMAQISRDIQQNVGSSVCKEFIARNLFQAHTHKAGFIPMIKEIGGRRKGKQANICSLRFKQMQMRENAGSRILNPQRSQGKPNEKHTSLESVEIF